MTDTIAIKPEMVKELRERTGAGMMDCKRALEVSGADMEKAIAWLREKGVAQAAGKAGRDAREGVISSYIHTGSRVGVLVEVNSETDFVARNDDFQKLVRDIAMQIAGLAPLYTTVESIPAALLEAKRAELLGDEATRRSPRPSAPRSWTGSSRSGISRWCSTSSRSVTRTQTVGQLITEAIARIGENIRVRRFARYALGEEL